MQRVHVVSVVVVAVLISAAALTHAQSSAPGPKRVLSLYRYARDYSDNVAKDQALQAAARASGGAFEYFVESLDLDRLPDAGQFDAMAQYLRRKYGRDGIDIVISNTQDVSEFLLSNLDIFPDAAMVTYGLDAPDREGRLPKGGLTGVVVRGAYTDTLNLALRLHPNTRNAFVVIDSTSPGEWLNRVVRQETQALRPRLNVEYLTDLALGELIAQVKQLPTDSVILYVRQAQNAPGRILIPRDILPLVSQSASAPTYGIAAAYQGFGVVGGYVFTAEDAGRMLADIVLRIVNGTHANDIPIATVSGTPTFDWRELQRWRIDESLLPSGSNLRFKVPTAWEQYRWYIAGTLALVLVQAVLISGLLAQRIKRRRAEDRTRESESALRTSHDRIRQLAGGLLRTQETTQARIARDLHDDVCQQLAAMSIDIDGLQKRGGDLGGTHNQRSITSLQRRAGALVEGVRRLSHDLHPSTMRFIGLAAAVRSHGAEVEQRHGTQVKVETRGDLQQLSEETALCLFRISQEALRNAASHGKARRIEVSIAADSEWIEMTIADDGTGFTVDERLQGGLGLVSMEERARAVCGQVRVDSTPGQGTTIRARVPARSTDAQPASPPVHDETVVPSPGQPPRQSVTAGRD